MKGLPGKRALVNADVRRRRRAAGIDILINNAGIQITAETHELDVADFDKVLAVNLRGAFPCAQQAVRSWVDEGLPVPVALP